MIRPIDDLSRHCHAPQKSKSSLHPNLLTKTLFPIARTKQVQRGRLVRMLDPDHQRPITLIIAPAGYGKTTLLSQWIATLANAEHEVAWVSLDEHDNEPIQVLELPGRGAWPDFPPPSPKC